MNFSYNNIPALNSETGFANAIVDTPKGSRNKFKFDEEKGLFKLKHVLPEGMAFPFDFGFIPNTLTEDGDPLDVLILPGSPTFAGCLVEIRIIGVLEAEQTGKDGKAQRNDRLIGVFAESEKHKHLQDLKNLPKAFLSETEHFFRVYNEMREITFKILARSGAKKAQNIIQQGLKMRSSQK